VNSDQGNYSIKRRFARVPLSLEVNIRFDDIKTFISEYSSDLSVGGIFIKTRKPRDLGTQVTLSIHLQDGQRLIEATGRVVRVVHSGDAYTGAVPGMAIEFTELHPKSRRIIEQYIKQYTPGK
jgi:uncharacterized protein (TIGR02266 family)